MCVFAHARAATVESEIGQVITEMDFWNDYGTTDVGIGLVVHFLPLNLFPLFILSPIPSFLFSVTVFSVTYLYYQLSQLCMMCLTCWNFTCQFQHGFVLAGYLSARVRAQRRFDNHQRRCKLFTSFYRRHIWCQYQRQMIQASASKILYSSLFALI